MKELISKFKEAFGDCKRIGTSTCADKTSYEIVTHRTIFVFDDRQTELPIKLFGKRENFQLTVNNRNQYENEVCIVKTDKCLFTIAHKKCDCIIFNRKKFFLVEISEAGSSGRNKKRQDAVEQLITTIDLLNDHKFDLSGYERKAIICFKTGQIRPTQPSLNTKRAIFLETYNIDLEEGNEISF